MGSAQLSSRAIGIFLSTLPSISELSKHVTLSPSHRPVRPSPVHHTTSINTHARAHYQPNHRRKLRRDLTPIIVDFCRVQSQNYTNTTFSYGELCDGIVGPTPASRRARGRRRSDQRHEPCRRIAAGAGGEERRRCGLLGGVPGGGETGDAHGEAAGRAQPTGRRPLGTHGRTAWIG